MKTIASGDMATRGKRTPTSWVEELWKSRNPFWEKKS